MPNTYYLWEQTNIYTNFGTTELFLLHTEFKRRGDFYQYDGLTLPGIYGTKTYSSKLLDMAYMENPSSKVYYITTRYNDARAPIRSFYNPMHVFFKTQGQQVFAKNLAVGDSLVSIAGEVFVRHIEVMDYVSSKWVKITTDNNGPNIFINDMVTFPTKEDWLAKFEEEQNALLVDKMEYEDNGAKEEINDISKIQVITNSPKAPKANNHILTSQQNNVNDFAQPKIVTLM